MPALLYLKPGTRFLQPDLGLTGTLVRVNECGAMVRIDGQERVVEFAGHDRQPREFKCNRTTTVAWSPNVWVTPIGMTRHQSRKNGAATMATKSKQTSRKPKAATKARKPKADGKPKRMSALDAAAKVLAETRHPMTAKQMIEAMAARGYWRSPGGKTPEATLYAAIIREVATKAGASRFKKHDRGQFVASTAAPSAKPAAQATGKKTAAKKKPTAKKATTKKTSAKNTAPADGTPGPKAVSELFKV